MLQASELVLNDDGSIYHLHLHPEQLADTVLTVGDPDRVAQVSQYFDRIEHQVQKREFVTHTGYLGQKRITVISSGIGTDNIDIVLNELDALASIDLQTRNFLPQVRSLQIMRLGTSGCMRADLPIGSFLASSFGLGLDGLMHFYQAEAPSEAQALGQALTQHLDNQNFKFPLGFYPTQADAGLLERFNHAGWAHGITLTANGFYGPQHRHLRLQGRYPQLFEPLESFDFFGHKVSNLEMETAGIYGMASALGHRALSLNALLANRRTGEFAKDPQAVVKNLIEKALEVIADLP